MINKTFNIKLSHLIIGGILLLLLIFLVKCEVKKPVQTDKYAKEKKEIERLKHNIFLYAINLLKCRGISVAPMHKQTIKARYSSALDQLRYFKWREEYKRDK